MADRRKLAQGLMMMTPSARADIAQQADEFERFKQADYLRKMGEQGAGLAKSVARGVPQMATGLVDLASMPFEAAGVLQPGQAVGSTKWLESRGYLPESQPGFANQLTELLSGGFDPSDLVTKGLPALGMIGKTVWHGSPHGFTKFDMSKIGTGEGAQAYGHGLYLAEARPVAEEYKQALSNPEVVLKSGERISNPAVGSNEDVAKAWLEEQFLKGSATPFDDAISRLNKLKAAANNPKQFEGAVDVLNQWKNEGATVDPGGYLYKVDLPDEQIAKMLDWDKPMNQQSDYVLKQLGYEKGTLEDINREADALMQKYGDAATRTPEQNEAFYREYNALNDRLDKLAPSISGGDYYRGVDESSRLHNMLGGYQGDAASSANLMQQGIPGIQYLDQASRGAGEGTRNYVVFSDEIPQILERNGQPIAQALREYKQTPSFDEFRSMAASGKMRQAKTEAQEIEDLLSGKSKFAEVRWNWDDPDVYDKADELSAKGFQYKETPNFNATLIYKSPEDIAKIESAKTPIQFGEAYGYSPNDIASFYMNRRQAIGNEELENLAYKEYLKDLAESQK